MPTDFADVCRINELAFGRPDEARLVERLRETSPFVSLVAVEADAVVGHLLFSRVTLSPENDDFSGFGLAPMAVLPDRQRTGVGSKLVVAGLEACRKLGASIVVVLGHRDYYPRFGFAPAHLLGFTCEYDVPKEAFMALELTENASLGINGQIRYAPPFAEL